jgi:uncharacterized protein
MKFPAHTNRRRFLKTVAALAASPPLWSLTAKGADADSPKSSNPGSPKRVLLVTGQDYPGHLWRQTAPVLAELLQKDSRLAVTTIEDPQLLDSPAIAKYDVILLHFMNWEQPSPGQAARENLQRVVASGKGLMLTHFTCGAWQDWPDFVKLAGRVWDPKLRGHDPHGRFRVEIVDLDHPITKGLEPFETVDELYTCLTGEVPIHVVATARSKVDNKDYPIAFVLNYGQGRVFHTVLGHDVTAFTNSGVPELLRRGCAWAARLT